MDKLMALCASHINSMEKINWFNQMLESWNVQTIKIPIHISVSIDKHMHEEFNKLKKQWSNEPLLYIYDNDMKLSQFQHYSNLVDRLVDIISINIKYVWVIFTDDDDLWHKSRTLYYVNAIEKCYNEQKDVEYIKIPFYSRNDLTNSKIDEITEWTNNTSNVRGEYIEYACRLNIFKKFFDKLDKYFQEHYLADLIFGKYLASSSKGIILHDIPKSDWVYYYRGNSNPSSGNSNRNFNESIYFRKYMQNYKQESYNDLNSVSLFCILNKNIHNKDDNEILDEYQIFLEKHRVSDPKIINIMKSNCIQLIRNDVNIKKLCCTPLLN